MHARLAPCLWLLALVLPLSALPAHGFDLQGHRGARGLAPENTLAGFDRALDLGVHTLELDVGLSADGVVVVTHDRVLNSDLVRDAQGRWLDATAAPKVHALTLAQLQTYDVGRLRPGSAYAASFASQQPVDGQRMPTLAEVFQRVRSRGADAVRFNIETKLHPGHPGETASPEQMADALLRTVRESGMAQRVSIQSFDWRSLQHVQRQAPGIPTVYLTLQTPRTDTVSDGTWTAGLRLAEHGSVPKMVKAAGGKAWSPNAAALTREALREAQGLGLAVIPWTVNAPADMERLLEWGVDGLITDYPDRLREVMRRRGMDLPAAAPR